MKGAIMVSALDVALYIIGMGFLFCSFIPLAQ